MSFIDNKKVSDKHQEGISRVIQRGSPAKTWQSGDMSGGMRASDKGFKRSEGASLTPRKA